MPEQPRAGSGPLIAPTAGERSRFTANAPEDLRRFHYRYIAAEHAWAAALLMPDDTVQLATALCEAGCWLKDRDPQAAMRFYQALIDRCPSTALGKQAKAKHWFPQPAQ